MSQVVVINERDTVPYAEVHETTKQLSAAVVRLAKHYSKKHPAAYCNKSHLDVFNAALEKGDSDTLLEHWEDRFLSRVHIQTVEVTVP